MSKNTKFISVNFIETVLLMSIFKHEFLHVIKCNKGSGHAVTSPTVLCGYKIIPGFFKRTFQEDSIKTLIYKIEFLIPSPRYQSCFKKSMLQ